MKYRRLLQDLGLSEKTATAYETLLKHGGLTATQFAEVLEMQRTNAYPIATELVTIGLAVRKKEEGATVFYPEHPSALQKLIHQKEDQLAVAQNSLDSHMDELLTTYNLTESRVGVFRFEGLRGLERAYDELLKDAEDVSSIMDRDLLRDTIKEYNPKWVDERRRRRMNHRIISPEGVDHKTDDETDRRTIRHIPRDKFPFEMDVKITSQKVILTTFAKDALAGVIVSDPEVSKNFQVLFDYLWKQLDESDATE